MQVQIIDLGDVLFGLEDKDFMQKRCAYLPFQEYQMSPELAIHLAAACRENEGSWPAWVVFPHDARHRALWKFGVLIYGILHGFWPWDNPPRGGYYEPLLHYDGDTSDRRVNERRRRIINMALPIDENLSQDCKDVLRAMFRKNPVNRPSLAELQTFPWFRQKVTRSQIFERPFSRAFHDAWSRRW